MERDLLRAADLEALAQLYCTHVGSGVEELFMGAGVEPSVAALKLATEVGAKVMGVVTRDGGYTAKVADAGVIVPTVNPNTVHTPLG